jgi:RHS repeat-associated protein
MSTSLQRRRRSRFVNAVAFATAVVLTVTLADVPARPVAAAPVAKPAAAPECPADRPDAVSASLTARLCRKRIEVLSARTEKTDLWALPEGGFSSQVYTGPVRFRRDGAWKPVDLSLQAQPDGSVAPVGHPRGLKLSGKTGAGEHALATVDVAGDTLSMAWTGALPKPVLSANTATYSEVRPGVDLVLTATRTGFEQSFVARDRQAAQRVASVTLPLRSKALRFLGDGPGSFAIRDAKNVTRGRIPSPRMWDAQRGAAGEITREKPLRVQARPRKAAKGFVAKAGVDAAGGTGAIALRIDADTDWLADPATVYPVTIDPTVDVDPASDTFVRTDSTIDRSGANEIEFGKSAGYTARGLLTWPMEQFAGASIRSAKLHLWNWYAATCTNNGWWATTVQPYTNPVTWASQPAYIDWAGYSVETRGFSSACDDGWITMDVKAFAQRAADNKWVNGYMGLQAYNESTVNGWKQVRSLQADDDDQIPHLTIDFDAAPFVTGLTTSPATAACATGAGRPWISSRTPVLRATVSDADTANLPVTFEWAQAGSNTLIGTQTLAGVPSNTAPSVTVPAGAFTDGGSYSWRVRTTDGVRTTTSPWCEFTVDTSRPGVPAVSSALYPSIATANTWGHGGAGQAGTFTFAPARADSDIVGFTYQLDTDTAPATIAVADPTTVQITPGADGRRTLTVQAKDRAGQLSEPSTYVFNVGRAGLKLPQAGANVIKRTKLAVDGDATLNRVTFQYRRAPGGAEYDIPLGNLHKADGSPVTAVPVRRSELGDNAIWDAADTLGTVGGVAQVRAMLYPDDGGPAGYPTQWVTVTVDPDGAGAAGDEIGPGSVNLLTGDYSVSAGDGGEFGLNVSRSSSSREPAAGWVPQGERLSVNQRQIGSDTTGFSAGSAVLTRVTDRGQGSSTDALQVVPAATSSSGYVADTYASVGGDLGGLRLDMKAGRRYRFTGWIYAPEATGLNPTMTARGERIVGFYKDAAGYHEMASAKAGWVDGWQELTVDLAVPAGATEAFVRLYNGFDYGSNKPVLWDNLSMREVVAPFGPQWRGGTDGGAADVDYESLSFPSPDLAKVTGSGGDYFTFGRSTSGVYFPEPDAAELSLVKVSDTEYELREVDGKVTRFSKRNEAFPVTATWTAEQDSTTRYLYESADHRNLVKRVASATEPGVGDCMAATPARGCRVLEYDYAEATTATTAAFGDVADQVRGVKVWSWDAATGTESAVEVAHYAYDDQRRLREVWDPRVSPALKTTYLYDDAGRVTTLGTPGQLPWSLDYGAVAGDDNAGRLLKASRAALKPGTTDQLDGETAMTVGYGVPLTKAAGGPHNLDAPAITTWGQKDLPTDATAVFGADSAPSTGGYGRAAITYLNASGQMVNRAVPGGFIDSWTYDEFGNAVWNLESANRSLALGLSPDAPARSAELNLPGDTAARGALLATVKAYSPDGLDLLETTGPVAKVALERQLVDPAHVLPTLAAGTQVVARSHTRNAYDQGKPDGDEYHLLTAERTGAAVSGYPDADVRETRTGYDAVDGGASGWTLKTATSTTTEAGTTSTKYDSAGRVVKEMGIGATGSDARTTETVYYTAGANGTDAACGNRPEWAGSVCLNRTAGAVTGHDPARASTTLPAKRIEEYSRYGKPSKVAETADGKTHRTTTGYDLAGRPVRVATTADDSSAAVEPVLTGYGAANGQATTTTAGSAVITREYDKLGRLITYTDANAATTRTEFDRYGQPTRVTDNTGSTAYAYDRTLEPRGLMTSMTDSVAGTFSAKYGPDGQLIEVKYPGGVTRTDTLNAGSTPVSRVYQRDSDGTVLYAETVVGNTAGQAVSNVYTGGSKAYGYDAAGRLTTAKDLSGAVCTSRTYDYDARTNRTSKKTGECQAENPGRVETHAYDSADRIMDDGYGYDAFGRTTTMPGGLTHTFYANDRAATQQLGDTRLSWTLDPAQRIRTATTATLAGGTWSSAAPVLSHYGDDTDEPRWIVENTTTGAFSRNVSGPDGDLIAITGTGGTRLQLLNLHGDVAVSIDSALTSPQVHTYDEFGAAGEAASDPRYGWLGGKQRSGDALGDTILMGVRLYSPGTGRFASVDPVVGGNANAYDYCSGDGVNCTDLTGAYSRWYISCGRSNRKKVSYTWTSGYNYNIRCDFGHGWLTTTAALWAMGFESIGLIAGLIGGPPGVVLGIIFGVVMSKAFEWWYETYCRKQDGAYLKGTIYHRWTNGFGPRYSWTWSGRFGLHCH